MHIDHVNCTSMLLTTPHHVSPFFPDFFPDFLIIFTLLTILGNAHRPCLHSLSFHNNLTINEYRVQKKPCHLDHNCQSYIETFIFAKNDD